MNRTSIISIFFLSLGLILNPQTGSAIEHEKKFIHYENATLGIKIDHPEEWSKVGEKFGVKFIAANKSSVDRFQEDLRIEVYPSYDYPLASIINEKTNKTSLKEFELIENENADVNMIESRDIIFKGLDASLLVYNVTSVEGLRIKAMSIFFEKNDRTYSVSYNAEPSEFDYYKPIIFDMLNSVDFITSVTPMASNYLHYPDVNQGFKFQYPSNWELTTIQSNEDEGIIAEISTQSPKENHFDPFRERVRFLVQNYSHIDPSAAHNEKLLVYAKYWIGLSPIQNISALSGRLGQSSAYIMNYTLFPQDFDLPLRVMTSFTVKDNNVYLIQFTAQHEKFDIYLPIVRKIIGSFGIVEATN